MRNQNIEEFQWLHNFHRSLSIIPGLLHVTGEKDQLEAHEKSLIDKEYSCRDVPLMNAICQINYVLCGFITTLFCMGGLRMRPLVDRSSIS